MRNLPVLRCPLLLALTLLVSVPVSAELVVTRHGRVIKVDKYTLSDSGRKLDLELPSGGVVTLPVTAVSRILDDEIVPEPQPIEEPEISTLAYREDQPAPETPFGELIQEIASKHDLNANLVAAVVSAESSFNPEAVSVKGARGLMQLMPATAERFGVRTQELFDPGRNIEAGVTYLAWLRERFDDDLSLILAAYNAGEGAVARHDGVPPYRETRKYVRRVIDRFEATL